MLPVPGVPLSFPQEPQHPCRAHVHDRCPASPVLSVLHREETAFQLAAELCNASYILLLLSAGGLLSIYVESASSCHAATEESQVCRGRPPTPPVPVQCGAVLGCAGSKGQ